MKSVHCCPVCKTESQYRVIFPEQLPGIVATRSLQQRWVHQAHRLAPGTPAACQHSPAHTRLQRLPFSSKGARLD
ncbi:hypothetical protein PCLA_08r0042 [Pseudomonas citronellolis]|nr:hypothetical protein PCLA_08r0042 [Pseudomonas citronellolis]